MLWPLWAITAAAQLLTPAPILTLTLTPTLTPIPTQEADIN